MRLEIPCGERWESVIIPDDQPCDVLFPRSVRCGEARDIIGKAMNASGRLSSFAQFIDNKTHPLVIVNDATRPTPTALVLDLLYPYLQNRDTRYLIATGAHRAPTEEEYRYIFGHYYPLIKDRIAVHDARESEVTYLGRTRTGHDLFLNALLWEADGIIAIGSIEPHYFAGYTGGRKSFMPGVARYDCIEANHKLATSSAAQLLTLEGNPVAEDLDDAGELVRQKFDVFAIMTVLDGVGNVYAAATGDLDTSFRSLLPKADEVFVAPIEEEADIVVTVAREPMDIDLYQSQKALENARLAMKRGGIMMLVSPCRTGTGAREFLDLLSAEETPEAVLDHIRREYRLGYHKAGKMVELALMGDLWAVTPLNETIITKAKMRPFSSVSQAMDEALKGKGKGARVLVVMDGGMTIPRVRK